MEADKKALIGFDSASDVEGVDGEETDKHEVAHAGEADQDEFDQVRLMKNQTGEAAEVRPVAATMRLGRSSSTRRSRGFFHGHLG